MNGNTIDTNLPIPDEIAAALSFETWPDEWTPKSKAVFGATVRRLLIDLIKADVTGLVPAGAPLPTTERVGFSVRKVYKEIFGRGKLAHGLLFYGGTRFEDPTGNYSRFAEALFPPLLEHAQSQNQRLLCSSGGGGGWPMATSQELFHKAALAKGSVGTYADLFSVLLRKGSGIDGRANGLANPKLVIWGQESLFHRNLALLFPTTICFVCPGGFGTFSEHSDVSLQNQLFSIEGPLTLGTRLIVLLDYELPDEVIAKSPRLKKGARAFDWFEEMRISMCAQTLAGVPDFNSIIKINVDDPDSAKTTAEQCIKWFEMCAEIKALEREAAKGVLEAQ